MQVKPQILTHSDGDSEHRFTQSSKHPIPFTVVEAKARRTQRRKRRRRSILLSIEAIPSRIYDDVTRRASLWIVKCVAVYEEKKAIEIERANGRHEISDMCKERSFDFVVLGFANFEG